MRPSGEIAKDQIEGKARLHIDYEDRAAIFDSLILCRFFRDFILWDELAAIVRALGREPASLDAGAVRAIGAVLRKLAQSTARFRCTQCGFASTTHFWQCPGCKTWDSQRPLAQFDLAAGLDAGVPAGGERAGSAPKSA